MQQDGRILPSAEEKDRALRFGRHLTDDEDGEGLQEIEMAQRMFGRAVTRAVTEAPARSGTGTGDAGGWPWGTKWRQQCPWDLFES